MEYAGTYLHCRSGTGRFRLFTIESDLWYEYLNESEEELQADPWVGICYPGTHIPDFGKLYNVPLEDTDTEFDQTYYTYNLSDTSMADIEAYYNVLKMIGMKKDSTLSLGYEVESLQVVPSDLLQAGSAVIF